MTPQPGPTLVGVPCSARNSPAPPPLRVAAASLSRPPQPVPARCRCRPAVTGCVSRRLRGAAAAAGAGRRGGSAPRQLPLPAGTRTGHGSATRHRAGQRVGRGYRRGTRSCVVRRGDGACRIHRGRGYRAEGGAGCPRHRPGLRDARRCCCRGTSRAGARASQYRSRVSAPIFAEQDWNEAAEPLPRGALAGPGRPGPATGKRRLPGTGRHGEAARKRPRKRKKAGGPRAARGELPAGPEELREVGQRPDTDVPDEPAEESGKPVGLSRRQRRNRQKRQAEPPAGSDGEQGSGPGPPDPSGSAEAPPEPRSAALRARMEERLLGARFRYLNQQLYTGSSRDAARLFRADPAAFHLYHRGFERQVRRWPERPVQRIVRYLRRRPASLVVADFGCGDCTLAASVKNQVHCFDLVPLCPRVTVCDMAKVPLAAESVDVAVFCLALMGTNLQEILGEANRVLKLGGTLMVAEVASRFEDTRAFLKAMMQLGFKTISKDLSSSYFYLLEFTKTGPARPGPAPGLRLRPCLYKRR
ncbi:ribosomal RNA-processing protein 8 [Cinclus cinclus]